MYMHKSQLNSIRLNDTSDIFKNLRCEKYGGLHTLDETPENFTAVWNTLKDDGLISIGGSDGYLAALVYRQMMERFYPERCSRQSREDLQDRRQDILSGKLVPADPEDCLLADMDEDIILEAVRHIMQEEHEPELGHVVFGTITGDYPLVPRAEYQDIFVEWLNRNGFDGYGCCNDSKLAVHDGGFENDVFRIKPYYWGEDEKEAEIPNFTYKPEGIEISWYKYPMRDARCNQNISPDRLREILEKCRESLDRKQKKEVSPAETRAAASI